MIHTMLQTMELGTHTKQVPELVEVSRVLGPGKSRKQR